MLFADLMPPVLLEAKGCPEITAERVMRDVVRDLYLNHPIWIRTDLGVIVEEVGTISLPLPLDSEVVEFRSIRLSDGSTIAPRVVDDNAFYSLDDATTEPVVAEVNGVWVMKPAPSVALTEVRVVTQLAPTVDATGVDDTIAARHKSMYTHATLARLLVMPDQKWTNPGMAQYHAQALAARLAEARRRADGWTTIRTPVVRYGGI